MYNMCVCGLNVLSTNCVSSMHCAIQLGQNIMTNPAIFAVGVSLAAKATLTHKCCGFYKPSEGAPRYLAPRR